MSFVIAAPETVAAAASDLARIGSTISAANAAAAAPTASVLPAAADEVSAAISSSFGSYAQRYQALSAQVAAVHNEFVQLLRGGAQQYAAAEAANASPLQAAATTGTGTGTTTNNPPQQPSLTPLQRFEKAVNTFVQETGLGVPLQVIQTIAPEITAGINAIGREIETALGLPLA
ncbi:Mycobacterium terramassiliense ORFan [Mycobacterium terramassiliense]|uniref:Mycobacterium terramassiliense ORFan n=1 Tax=Mycobacterium terramassiliense TaxID=1841859 RepID=A0A2U3N950_9MYCO|nr:PE family protein [Mycobacterium terramassiliense]SPM28020.1 Mycobacterium terramassiliense ORFan [Mycobacterium terramassiliense]